MKTIAGRAIFLILFSIALICCEKDSNLTGDLNSFYYEQTALIDPWHDQHPTSDAELQVLVSNYLINTLGIEFSNLRITHDGTGEMCYAAHCKTGRIIRIKADKVYQDVLTENGFKLE